MLITLVNNYGRFPSCNLELWIHSSFLRQTLGPCLVVSSPSSANSLPAVKVAFGVQPMRMLLGYFTTSTVAYLAELLIHTIILRETLHICCVLVSSGSWDPKNEISDVMDCRIEEGGRSLLDSLSAV